MFHQCDSEQASDSPRWTAHMKRAGGRGSLLPAFHQDFCDDDWVREVSALFSASESSEGALIDEHRAVDGDEDCYPRQLRGWRSDVHSAHLAWCSDLHGGRLIKFCHQSGG